jgi:NADH dehydrogenase FAD-containing subunit
VKVVVAGLGDSGLLTAIKLAAAKDVEVVGISSKPGLVSGQELGWRLSRPGHWAQHNWITFDRYRGLDRVRTLHGELTGADLAGRTVSVRGADGVEVTESFDALVVSTGVRNGFWRQPALQTADEIDADIGRAHDRLAAASSVIVVGGGAAAVSSAANIALTWPDTRVDLYFPGDGVLTQYHQRTRAKVVARLDAAGVHLHPGHRAVLPDGFTGDEITTDSVAWSTGQPPATADAVLWTVGLVRPNTGWLPTDVLDEDGFVRVTPELRVPGYSGVFAIGDVAATDPLRSSARNRADGLLAHNILADAAAKPLKSYRPPRGRWGSVLGIQRDGLEVFAPNGRAFRFPAWSFERVLMPWIVRRGIYRGIRRGPRVSSVH